MSPAGSVIFARVARVLFYALHLFALHLLLRGHNEPGGGFIGGLVAAISFIMLGLALGWREVTAFLRVDPARLAAVGLAVAATTAVVPMLAGHPPLTHFFWHLPVPGLGKWHVGTPLPFDVGVYLVVVGIATKMIFLLGRSTEGLGAFGPGEPERYASSLEEPIEPAESGGANAVPRREGGGDAD